MTITRNEMTRNEMTKTKKEKQEKEKRKKGEEEDLVLENRLEKSDIFFTELPLAIQCNWVHFNIF